MDERSTIQENRFLASWDIIEENYRADDFVREPALPLIKEMRDAGYDKQTLAGTSLYDLVLSRSKRYGLRQGQSSIRFRFVFLGGMPNIRAIIADSSYELNIQPITLVDEVRTLLDLLVAQPID